MVTQGYQKKEAQKMTRETWEMWADEYQEYYEDETPVYPDDMEEFKKEEQKVIDEVIRAIQGLSS